MENDLKKNKIESLSKCLMVESTHFEEYAGTKFIFKNKENNLYYFCCTFNEVLIHLKKDILKDPALFFTSAALNGKEYVSKGEMPSFKIDHYLFGHILNKNESIISLLNEINDREINNRIVTSLLSASGTIDKFISDSAEMILSKIKQTINEEDHSPTILSLYFNLEDLDKISVESLFYDDPSECFICNVYL